MKLFSLILLLFVGSSLQASTPTSPSYEAGVVEFSYERNDTFTPAQTLQSNLNQYLSIMGRAPANLDIIVFPEMTLNGMETAVETPEPSDKISPCDNSSYPLENLVKQISCAAKSFERYVVVNIVTKAQCPDADMIAYEDPRNCSERADDMSYYNTNVVFDRTGALISRYRKFNLFGEKVDKPSKPAMISFETDFGVKFGHFVCFDLMFSKPALELVRNQSITDIVFTTMWFSEAPFLTAVQVQQNWAFSNNVNLLASGANNPEVGSTGTGIYAAKRGSLVSVMEGAFKTELYTATVPKIDLGGSVVTAENAVRYSPMEMKPLKLKRDQLDVYNMTFLSNFYGPGIATTFDVCYDDVCCTFKLAYSMEPTEKPYYRYAAAVYHGNRTFDGFADGGVFACAVLACQNYDIKTCGVRDESLEFVYEWRSLEITGTFPQGNQYFYLPTSLDTSVMPFGVGEFQYEEINNATGVKHISMKSVGSVKDFYAFGIYGRDFDLDEEADGAGLLKTSILFVGICALTSTFRSFV